MITKAPAYIRRFRRYSMACLWATALLPVQGNGRDTNVETTNSPQAVEKRPETIKKTVAPDSVPSVKPIVQEQISSSVKSISSQNSFIKNLTGRLLPSEMDDADARKQKIMALLIPVLLVGLVLAFVKVLGGPSRTIASSVAAADETQGQDVEQSEVNWKLPALYTEPSRDPMKSKLEIR